MCKCHTFTYEWIQLLLLFVWSGAHRFWFCWYSFNNGLPKLMRFCFLYICFQWFWHSSIVSRWNGQRMYRTYSHMRNCLHCFWSLVSVLIFCQSVSWYKMISCNSFIRLTSKLNWATIWIDERKKKDSVQFSYSSRTFLQRLISQSNYLLTLITVMKLDTRWRQRRRRRR